ncbi:MAG: hypothetical protein ACTSVY_09325 [Candidatus Helarchaeota archaeon]
MSEEVDIVKALFIFNKKSGRPFIRYLGKHGDFNIEPFLVIGFLTAILKFSKEVGRSELKVIDMEDLRFVFSEKDDVVCCAVTTKLINPLDLLFKVQTIQTIFLTSFTVEELNDHRIELEFFEKFIPIMEEILYGTVRTVSEDEINKIKSKLDDFIGFHKKIAGGAVISFTGDVLVPAFGNSEQMELVRTFFNAIFGTRVSGIEKILIDLSQLSFEGYSILIQRIEEETLLVLISKSGLYLQSHEESIQKLSHDISKLLKRKDDLVL